VALAAARPLAAQQERAPLQLPGDWEVGVPSSQRFDAAALEALSARLAGGEFGQVHGFLVARGGKLVFERYYGGWGMHQLHTVQSVTKSVTSALIGIAIAEGAIRGVDQPLAELLPEHRSLLEGDSLKRGLTLRHVLTMTLGNQWDERAAPYSSPANIVWKMAQAHDWMGFVLGVPMVERPGTRFNYNSGSSLLLAGILQNATGMQAHLYAEKRLFDPLGIPVYGWYRNLTHPTHWSHTGGGLNLRPRDLAKLGYLYVSGGKWGGKQIVPAEWIEASAKPRVQVNDSLWYGYQWWLLPLPPERGGTGRPGDVVHGRGWGGQFVFAVPRLDLVVVFTSGSFNDEREARRTIPLVLDQIPAALAPAGRGR
jgi:CubicO group peptidase (beta-lactamase class C family)